MESKLINQLLRNLSPLRTYHVVATQPQRFLGRLIIPSLNRTFTTTARANASTNSLPRVAQPSIWQSIVPKAFRRSASPIDTAQSCSNVPPKKAKEWNPATVWIVFSLLIGSQAIQTIGLKNDLADFNRKADAKIALLREVIRRVQNGEDVDVEGMLGTGDKAKEKEWEAVLREIEEEDMLWQSKKRRKEKRAAEERQDSGADAMTALGLTADSASRSADSSEVRTIRPPTSESSEAARGPRGFY